MLEIIAEIPFDTKKHEVIISQGFNGPFSHNKIRGVDLRHSIDFALPFRTEIRAVRDGIVSVVIGNGVCYRGLDLEQGRSIAPTTTITIEHEDLKEGKFVIFSMMQHIDPASILVESHDQVKKGQVIAKTGLDGWVGPIPHLHLQFHKRHNITTIPFKLDGYDEPLDDKSVVERLKKINNELCREILAIRRNAGLL